MPFPNEHSARQTDPGKYVKFRRGHPAGFPAGIDVVYGITKDGKSEIQTLRADASKWPAEKFRAWLKAHKFSTGGMTKATGKEKDIELETREASLDLPVIDEYGPWYTREASISFVGTGEDRSIRVIASTEDEDSHGTILRNWDLSRAATNLPVLFAHKRDSWPIGKTSEVEQRGPDLGARLTFADEKLNPEGERALQMFRADMIKAVSVGFCQGPNTTISTETRDNGRQVVVIDAPQLAEISVLPVGSNAKALAVANVRALAGLGERTVGASADEKRMVLQAAIRAKYPPAPDGYGPWVRDIFEDEVVFEQPTPQPGLMFAAPYTYDAATQTAEIGDAYRVRATYAPIKTKGRASRSVTGLVPDERDLETMAAKQTESATLETGDERDAKIIELQGRELKLTADLEAYKTRCVDLETRVASEQKVVGELNAQLAERDLKDLVGVKITPAELPGLIKLRGLSAEVYAEQLAAVKARPDMVLTRGAPVLPPDPNTQTLADVTAEDPIAAATREHEDFLRSL